MSSESSNLPAPARTGAAPAARPLRPDCRPDLRVLPGGQQLMLDLEYDIAPGVPAIPGIPATLHVVPTVAAAPETIPPGLPDPGPWVARLARAVAEVAVGERPAAQLIRHVAHDELARLARRGMHVQRHPSARAQKGTLRLRAARGIRVCPVAPGIVETSAVIVGQDRARAVAIRLEARSDRWLATVVDLI